MEGLLLPTSAVTSILYTPGTVYMHTHTHTHTHMAHTHSLQEHTLDAIDEEAEVRASLEAAKG